MATIDDLPPQLGTLTTTQYAAVSAALEVIDQRLQVEQFREGIAAAMAGTGFITTVNENIGAYTGWTNNGPISILNSRLFDRSKCPIEEFVVTIFHELLHVSLGAMDDKFAASEEEARHDLLSYEALGYTVPRDHWAFKNFPYLLEESTLKGMQYDNSERIYLEVDPSTGYPAGRTLFYECPRCGDIVPSLPKESIHCKCRNVTIDVDYGRIKIQDQSKIRVFSIKNS